MRKDVTNLIAAIWKTIYPMHIGSATSTDNLYKKSIPIKSNSRSKLMRLLLFYCILIKILNRINFLLKNVCTCSKLISYDYPPVVDIYQQRRIFRHSAERPAWRKTDREIS